MSKTIRQFLIFSFFIIFTSEVSNAQSLIALVDRANATGTTAAEGQGITVTGLSRGAGVTYTGGGDYNSLSWAASSLSTAKTNNDYLQFSILVNSGSLLDLDEMKIRMDRSGTGPTNVEIEYSTNAFSSAGTSIFSMTGLSKNGSIQTIGLTSISNINASSTITFRIYAWGAGGSGGTFDIEGFSNSYTATGWTTTISDPGIAINGCATPLNPTNITNTPVTTNSTTISWTNASCFNNMVVVGSLSPITTSPSFSVNPSTWSANTDWNNKVSVSSQMSGGSPNEYVLYVGTGSSATISNLPATGTLHYTVFNRLASWSSGGTQNTALPVEFIHFEAKSLNTHVLLSWSTASELNNHFFEVQKSISGEPFTPIAEVSGNGTTTETHHYNFTDTEVSPVAFYRLKQVDYDGTVSYSKIARTIYEEDAISFTQDKSEVTINFETFAPSQVLLLNSSGREILNDDIHSSYSIDKRFLASGIYVLIVKCNDQIYHYRFYK
jgi:hypothetical protein